ncbi:MAG: transcriptional regulator [Clostridium sp.]|nr:transcriptional regulator [Clostridium sp.]
MSKQDKTLNDVAWEDLFEKYDILGHIERTGQFQISAKQIREVREPRLMAKFDHSINLPKIFADNKLSILPITRGDYIISHFDAYHEFELVDSQIKRVSLPTYIQSIDSSNVTSETIALNCAVAAGIVSDFLEDEGIVSTVSGRMGSGNFSFSIGNLRNKALSTVTVSNSQIEIDAAYEGIRSLALFEAKRDLSKDFLIRQLYYPYRVWKNRVTKPVRPLFLVYSNGIYRIYEYEFSNPDNYSSIVLVRQRNYSVEDTIITVDDIQKVLHNAVREHEPKIPFPQADSFERIINFCELLDDEILSRNEVTELYAFDSRQTDYYTGAAMYLGLVEKTQEKGEPIYRLSDNGRKIMKMGYKQRQLALCRCVLSHGSFADTLKAYFETGVMPEKKEIVQIMKKTEVYNVKSDVTFWRRSSTIRGWVNWIVGLINE